MMFSSHVGFLKGILRFSSQIVFFSPMERTEWLTIAAVPDRDVEYYTPVLKVLFYSCSK